jgi:2-keto-4-pentenoate hydratase/2-oxohepta-3-ene-1,7-dioic acid hydratase in catechol pathway
MKFCRFVYKDGSRFGLVEERDGQPVIVGLLGTPQMQVTGAGVPEQLVMPKASTATALDEPIPLDKARLLTPFPLVSKVMCVGRNYAAHVRELHHEMPTEPLIFSKPPSSLLAPGGEIERPAISQRVDYEGELGVIIGRRCRHLQDGQSARDYILGYTVVNDVTARDLQNKDGQWTRAKGFDTFCPFGPVVVTDLVPEKGIQVQTRVNGQIRQDGNTRDMMFSIDRIIQHISQFCTLQPGDLIATGTPEGVGPVVQGDVVEVTVEGIGTLRNPVVDETLA